MVIYADTVTNDRFNIEFEDNRIVLHEARPGGSNRSRTHFTFNPENTGWKYLKTCVEFYERAQLLNGSN